LRHLPAEKMHARFPTISAICQQYGLDLARDLLPVAPAAHYYMGGVMVDTNGRTTLHALYAVGEVACTGVHGANRLASNSLLEGLVFGLRLADALQHQHTNNATPSIVGVTLAVALGGGALGRGVGLAVTTDGLYPTAVDGDRTSLTQINREIRGIMWQYVSLCRDEQGLLEARRRVQALKQSLPASVSTGNEDPAYLTRWAETSNMLLMAELVIIAALQRRESRGSHWRSDYNRLDESLTGFHYAYINAIPEPIFNIPQQEVLSHA